MNIGAQHILGGAAALWAIQSFMGDSQNTDTAGDCAYKVTQADLDAVESSLFVHPLDWLAPRVGTCIDSRFLGGPDDLIPGQGVFKWSDADNSKDGPVPYLWRPIVAQQAVNLSKLQEATGRKVKPSSWWRGPKASRAADQGEFEKRGGWGGYHPCGAAVDLKIEGWNNAQTHAAILDLIRRGVIPDGGVGIYDAQNVSSIHYDNRAQITGSHGGKWKQARWDRRPDPVTGKVDYSGGL